MKCLLCLLAMLLLTGCFVPQRMSSSRMNRLELGMTKEELTDILGSKYSVTEKWTEGGLVKETLLYRSSWWPDDREVYLFLLVDGRLESWHSERLPKYDIIPPQVIEEQ